MSAMPPNLTPEQKYPVGPATWDDTKLPFYCRTCHHEIKNGVVALTGKAHLCVPREAGTTFYVPGCVHCGSLQHDSSDCFHKPAERTK